MTDKTPQVDPVDDDQELDAPQQPATRNISHLEAELKAAREEAAKRRVAAKTMKSEFSQMFEQQNAQMAKLTEAIEAERKARLEVEARLERERAEGVRSSVASKYGLPPELAKRLQGSTPEELEADAAKLAPLIQKANSKPSIPGLRVSAGNSSEVSPDTAASAIRQKMGGGRNNSPEANPFFDVATHLEKGGGLVSDD